MSIMQRQQVTIIRGQGVDITEFAQRHPGGGAMLELSVGRDSTVMYESAHLRDDVADKALASLPKVDVKKLQEQGYVFDTTEEAFATPGQSALHTAIRKRIVTEVMKPLSKCTGTSGARGVPQWESVCVLGSWLLATAWFLYAPSLMNGFVLGVCMSWVGTGVQHTANHGGLSTSKKVNYLVGLTNDVCVGGSSLVWRYHHQVSHHAYCNDKELDQDVHSSFPLLRLDALQPLSWYHAYQHVYGFLSFSLLYFSVQWADFENLIEKCCYKVRFLGTSQKEIALAFALKALHYSWLFALPYALHGSQGMVCSLVACLVGSFWTALLFVVSHNLECAKPGFKFSDKANKDWAIWQIETSASWGGRVACFLMGGLNLQIEHHLFPCLPHNLHPAVAEIVKEECKKAGVKYNEYNTLPDIVSALWNFLKLMGDEASATASVVAQASSDHGAGAVAALKATTNTVVAEVSSVSISQTAKDMATSVADVKNKMEKDNSGEESYMQLMKPVLAVAVYQGLQEWYTKDWVEDSQDWQSTTVLKPAIMSVLYLSMIFFGTKFMETRKPGTGLRKYMLTYNLYQVVLNAWCVGALIYEVFVHQKSIFSFTIEESSPKLKFLIWVHYNNKFIELLDTTFMVFNKKKEQVSFLHVYHHVLFMWSWWAVCKWGCGGIAWFSAMFNSAIHVAMYGYYTLAALKLPCPWKKMLTMMQMGQFCFCMTSAIYALVSDVYPFYLSLLNIWCMLNMLALFGHFYRKKYSKSTVKTEKSTTKCAADVVTAEAITIAADKKNM